VAVINLAAGITADTVTSGKTVGQARCYTLQISYGGGTAVVKPEFSLDNANWFTPATTLTSISGTTGIDVFTIVDIPVVYVRLNVSETAGASVSASISY
jgi:hypothetical protein